MQGSFEVMKNFKIVTKSDKIIIIDYYKNYISTFQWKWILKRCCAYTWREFWRDFYGFYEWVTSTLVLNCPKLISIDDKYKKRHDSYPFYIPRFFGYAFFYLIAPEGCLTPKWWFQSVFSLNELKYSLLYPSTLII